MEDMEKEKQISCLHQANILNVLSQSPKVFQEIVNSLILVFNTISEHVLGCVNTVLNMVAKQKTYLYPLIFR